MSAFPVNPAVASQLPAAGEELSDGEFIDRLKAYLGAMLTAVKGELREALPEHIDACSAYSSAVDAVIRGLHERARRQFLAKSSDVRYRMAVVAVGGYGRNELCPRSDIDLLFLHHYKVDPYVEGMTERMLYPLWDLGLEVGHSVRNVKETLKMAAADDSARTALLDFRFVAGDRAFFDESRTDIEKFLFFTDANRFIETKIREMRKRHSKFGDTVFVLEPNVKEGVGGLRDLQTAVWCARIKYKSHDLLELRNKGVLATQTFRAIRHIQNYLLRVRSEMHFLTEKKTDILSVELQQQMAELFRYRTYGRTIGVERFMRAYYLHAASAARLSEELIEQVDRYLPEGAKKPFSLFRRKAVTGDGILYKGTIQLKDHSSFERDPVGILEFFRAQQKTRSAISVQAKKNIQKHLPAVGSKFREDPRAAGLFLSILGDPNHLRETLLSMNECRFLGRYIPEFAPLLCKVLHDVYHVYTVDIHSIRAASEIAGIEMSDSRTAEEERFLALYRTVARKDLLNLAILFHDIGKGRGHGHSEVGAELVAWIGTRMGLAKDEIDDLVFLVRHHLLMALASQRRDLHDLDLILSFAQTVGTVSRLDQLYLLTFADIRAVGPEVWTPWKAQLLAELYGKARNVLELGPLKSPFEEQARTRRERVREELTGLPAQAVDRFLARFEDRYFLGTPDGRFSTHLGLLCAFDGVVPMIELVDTPGTAATELIIVCPDQPGLFAKIAGTLSANGINILNASINTSLDGVALDTFYVTYMGKTLGEDVKKERLAADLSGVLRGDSDVRALIAERKGAPRFVRERVSRHRPTKVNFDNSASSLYTVVDIFTYDRIGLLYDITSTLTDLGIDIALSKISTKADQVADAFYLRERGGGKILSAERQEEVRKALLEAIAE